jgi:superfamily II DNA or RNA helicase
MDDHRTPAEQFEHDRLDRDGIDETQYPAQVDRAAVDVLRGIAVGKTDDPTDIGGTVDRFNFDEATGRFYVEGLTAIAGEDSTLAANLTAYDETQLGKLAFQLNGFRHTLQETGGPMDIDRALEALLEKTAAAAIDESVKSGGNEGSGLRALRDTDSVSDLTARLFSDPRVDAYAQALVNQLPETDASREELIDKLDEARMTTPLWDHQREALERWHANGQRGYVDMATATGKTVLGLAAMALRYGALHPQDLDSSSALTQRQGAPEVPSQPTVLIVAGNDLILDQWRSEIDEHLDIPADRTVPSEEDGYQSIELGWGSIEFRTAQSLSQSVGFSRYDLVILDEAHRYTRGTGSGSGWGGIFEDLSEKANAVLAMSGSVDQGWTGDQAAKDALENNLERRYKFDVAKARREGVIADFSWEVRYLPATGDQADRIASQTRITTANYDSETGDIDAAGLEVAPDALPDDVVDYDDLRSFVQSNDGNDLRSESPQFDAFASALLARKPLQWNQSPDADAIASLVADHAPEKKTVVLVQSYKSAAQLESLLIDEHGIPAGDIVAFTETGEDRLTKIKQFNEGTRGVIIGPGNLLGTGVDMPDAEVALNVSKGNVNASLVQRIGRVLRNPTGDKDAEFYHLVAQPVDEAAIDGPEDGAKLLEQAAEFRALGETFRETPSFSTDHRVTETIVDLENDGVTLLERIDDEDELVNHTGAAEHVRTLQALVYDATVGADRTDQRSTPVLETWTSESSGSASEGDWKTQFPDRNEAYERYRLSLGPYRALKAIVANHYEATVETEQEDDQYVVQIDDEQLCGTDLHRELERWLNSYKSWYHHCDNRNGDGEPGSLPQYKSEWPEPPEDKGVMVPREAVTQIGVSYAEADPIFFPYVDGELYSIPLPDGRVFTVNGIVEETVEGPTSETADEATGYTVDTLLFQVAHTADEDFEELLQDAVASLLKDAVDGKIGTLSTERTGPRTSADVSLPDRNERLLQGLVDGEEFQVTQLDQLLDAALMRELDLGSESRSVEVDEMLLQAATGILDEDEFESVEQFVERAVRDAIERTVLED